MTKQDFKELWGSIEGNQVNVKYGKSTFRNIVLNDYKESLGCVKVKGGENIYIRSIKSITLVNIQQPVEVVEPEIEVVQVTPTLPENWQEKGYFIISGKFGGNWKKAFLKDKWGNVVTEKAINGKESNGEIKFEHVELASDCYFKTVDCLNWVYALKNKLKDLAPDYLIDDTYAAPQFFDISSHVIKQIK